MDEGVLQLTAFATPDPLRYLLNDRALEVETRQMFDRSCRITASSATGLRRRYGLVRRAVPQSFQAQGEPPLSWWSGIVEVGAETSVTIPVPGYYNGRVRIMAVAASPDTAAAPKPTPRCAARWF